MCVYVCVWGGGWGGGVGAARLYLMLHYDRQNDSSIKMGSG